MKLGFVVIYVADVKRVLDFYSLAFGLQIRMQHEEHGIVMYGEMQIKGAILGFASHELGQSNLNGKYQAVTPENDPVGQEIVFVDNDVASVYAKAVEVGAQSIAEPAEKPWGQTVAYVRSIEGTLIEICSPMGS